MSSAQTPPTAPLRALTPQVVAAYRELLDAQWPRVRAELEALAAIPSVSLAGYDPGPVERSAQQVAELLADAGMQAEVVRAGGGHPAVIARIPAPPGAPTVLLYAHHDVQPTGDPQDWVSPPFEPTERAGRLYGRGVADDKAGVMAHVAAVRALVSRYGDRPPLGVTVFVEGEEEVGSASLPDLLAAHHDDLDADLIVLADSSNWAIGVPSLTRTLRGNVRVVVTVRALEHGVHSGVYGGPAPDALTAMCRLLATLHEPDGRVAVAGLTTSEVADVDYPPDRFRAEAGMAPEAPLLGRGSVAARLWGQPAITVIGIDAPRVDDSANLLVPRCRAKVSVRLAPDQPWPQAYQAVREHLLSNAPWGVAVEVELEDHGDGFEACTTGPYARAAHAALAAAWGREPVDIGQGGSIPFVAEFAERFPRAAILITGVEDPDTRAHGANESLHLAEFANVVLAEALLLEQLACPLPDSGPVLPR
ncbi:MAG: dipeptidase [Austwickia sp.]|nr:dipeptidase [Austwickia sp.]MBK9100819.1 dipeptidase [Austwickia sp.]